jgi:hypothetical protein
VLGCSVPIVRWSSRHPALVRSGRSGSAGRRSLMVRSGRTLPRERRDWALCCSRQTRCARALSGPAPPLKREDSPRVSVATRSLLFATDEVRSRTERARASAVRWGGRARRGSVLSIRSTGREPGFLRLRPGAWWASMRRNGSPHKEGPPRKRGLQPERNRPQIHRRAPLDRAGSRRWGRVWVIAPVATRVRPTGRRQKTSPICGLRCRCERQDFVPGGRGLDANGDDR